MDDLNGKTDRRRSLVQLLEQATVAVVQFQFTLLPYSTSRRAIVAMLVVSVAFYFVSTLFPIKFSRPSSKLIPQCELVCTEEQSHYTLFFIAQCELILCLCLSRHISPHFFNIKLLGCCLKKICILSGIASFKIFIFNYIF